MIFVVIAAALLVLFIVVRTVRGFIAGLSGSRSASHATDAMAEERDRIRKKDDNRRASDRLAANARHLQDDMRKRSRDRAQAETNRAVKAAVKRSRGW